MDRNNDIPPSTTGTNIGEQPLEEEPDLSGNFECNICFDPATEPCVTTCGHLFCWPCIWKWMNSSSHKDQVCPVCKSGIERKNIIPIYGRGRESKPRRRPENNNNNDENGDNDEENEEEVPHRPRGERSDPQPNPNFRPQNNMPFNPFEWIQNNNRRWGTTRTVYYSGNLTDLVRRFISPSRDVRIRSRHCISLALVALGFLILLFVIVS